MAGQDIKTRQRVLDVAAQLFAERGLRKVTVREICRRARANVAAVNYHFRNKAGLYREVLEMAIGVMRETNEAARRAAEGAARGRRLRAHIRVFVAALVSTHGRSWLHRLITRELADPTPALDLIVDRAVRPRIEYLSSIVRDLVGPGPTDAAVLACVVSIQAQCVMMALPNPIGDQLLGRPTWTPAAIDALADHIAEFSLGGIHAIGRRSDAEEPKPQRTVRRAAR
jgi:AcrR family transcriptional regulator